MIGKFLYNSNDFFEALERADKIKSLQLFFPEYDFRNYVNELLKFQKLEVLSIQFDINYPYKLPNEFGHLKTLKKLHILNYPFKKFPDWVFDLKKLENLMIRGNDIEEIPSSISMLTNLKHLRIENSKLQKAPIELSALTNLLSLSLVDNFDLKTFSKKSINEKLKMLALSPSGISSDILKQLETDLPTIKMNRRYFK